MGLGLWCEAGSRTRVARFSERQAGFVWKGGKQDVLQGEFGRRRAEFGCFRYRETSFCACTLQIFFIFYAAKQIRKREESLHNEPVIHQG